MDAGAVETDHALVRAGNSIAVLGSLLLVASIVAAVLANNLVMDFTGPLTIWLGFSVKAGGRVAAKWAVALSVLMALVAILLLSMAVFGTPALSVGGKPATPGMLPFAVAFVLVVGVWCLANAMILIRHFRRQAEE